MNIVPLSVNTCTPIKKNYKQSTPSFGKVIPVSILYDNHHIISQCEANQEFFQEIMHKLVCGVGCRTKVGKRIAEKLKIIDPDFRINETIRTIKNGYYVDIRRNGRLTPVVKERYFATGNDASHIIELGNNNFRRCEDKQDAKIALIETESGLCKDLTNRIKGVKSFIISVIPEIVNKGKKGKERTRFVIQDAYFMLEKGEYQRLTKQAPPTAENMSEIQKKLFELFPKRI